MSAIVAATIVAAAYLAASGTRPSLRPPAHSDLGPPERDRSALAATAAVLEPARTELAPPPLQHVAAAGTARAPAPAPDPGQYLRWVDDLRDDGIPWNATRAWSALAGAEVDVLPYLQPALRSPDRQQRQFAGQILVSRGDAESPELAEVAVELLRSDASWTPFRTSLRGEVVRWLDTRTGLAGPALSRGLYGSDDLQRFLCAFLLARECPVDHRNGVCAVLVARLRDNHVAGDATMAAHGLYRIGPEVLDHVRASLPYADAQAHGLLRLVELDLVDPPRDRAALESRRAMQDVTTLYHDPVLEYRIDRPRVPAH